MDKDLQDKIDKIITPHGVLVNGIGITNNKLDDVIKMLDRANFLAAKREEKIERLINKLDELIKIVSSKLN